MIRIEVNGIDVNIPKGWDDMIFSYKRDEVYHGIDFTTEFQYTFIKNAFDLIDNFIRVRNFDADLRIDIYYKNTIIFSGEINLFDFRKVNKEIQTSIKPQTFFEKIKNRQTVNVDLYELEGVDGNPLSVVDKLPFNFQFNAIPIESLSIYKMDRDNSVDYEMTGINALVSTQILMPLSIIEDQIIRTNEPAIDESRGGTSAAYLEGAKEITERHIDTSFQVPNIGTDYTINYNMSGVLGFTQTSSAIQASTEISIRIYYGANGFENFVSLFSASIDGTSGQSVSYNISGTEVITLAAGDKLSFVINWTSSQNNSNIPYDFTLFNNNAEWDISIFGTTVFPTSSHKVCAIYEAMNRVLEHISGESNVLISNYYGRTNSQPTAYSENGCGSFRIIQNGANIRGFEASDPNNNESEDYRPPITNLERMFDSCNAIDNIGLDVDERSKKVVIEAKEHFYDKGLLIANLGEIENVTFRIDAQKYYTIANVGYLEWDEEINNGLSEFATERQYTNKTKNNESIYDIISEYLASPYAIEYTRRREKNLFPNSKQRWDDNIFIIQTWRRIIDGHPTLSQPSTVNVGVIGEKPTDVQNADSGDFLYNIELSPARNFLRHLNILQRDWQFQSGKGNIRMKSTVDDYGCVGVFDGNELSERQDLNQVTPLFVPVSVQFEIPVKFNEFLDYRNRKFGYFEFEYKKEVYQGFIFDVTYDMQTNLCNFELMLRR